MINRILNWFGYHQRSTSGDLDYKTLVLSDPNFTIAPTDEGYLTHCPFWRAVNLISGDLSKLPLNVYKCDAKNPKIRTLNTTHPANFIGRNPSDGRMGPVKFWRRFYVQLLIYSNAYAAIERNGMGAPMGLRLLESGATHHTVDDHGETGYWYLAPQREWQWFPYTDVIHVEDLSLHQTDVPDLSRVRPTQLIRQAKNTLNSGLAIERFGRNFFSRGGRMGGTLEIPETFTKKSRDRLEAEFKKTYETLEAAFSTVVTRGGAKFHAQQVKPDETQMVESWEQQLKKVALWFGCPANKLGNNERAAYNTYEMEQKSYWNECLQPRAAACTDELDIKIFVTEERRSRVFCMRYDSEELVMPDQGTRTENAVKGYQGGVLDRDEARLMIGRNPATPDQTFLDPLNMTPSDEDSETDQPESEPQVEDENNLRWVQMPLEHDLARALKLMGEQCKRQAGKMDPHQFAEWFRDGADLRSTWDRVAGVSMDAYAGATGHDGVRQILFQRAKKLLTAKINENKQLRPEKRAKLMIEELKNEQGTRILQRQAG